MGNDDYLTDDYVADLLAKDAKDCSLKYSAMGMEAFTSSSKKPANAPKPNTRFLRHIIKNTDTHNKNLLAKEEVESKARLKDLERNEEVKRLKTNPNSGDIRRRQMGDIHAILGGKRPKKSKDDTPSSSKPEASERRSRKGKEEETSGQNDDLFARRDKRKSQGRLVQDDEEHDSHKKSSSRRSRRHSHSEDEDRSARRDRRRRDRSRSPRRRNRSRSPNQRSAHKHRHRSPVRSKHTPLPTTSANDSDSDPLDDLIGPQPAPKPRGRGALAGSSGIDRRFSDTYDPTTDVQMEEAEPQPARGMDFDDEVEAFRDRQKLKQAQESRLRSAGFGDDDIMKAEKGVERVDEDVRWSKKGEKREWDRGKDLDE